MSENCKGFQNGPKNYPYGYTPIAEMNGAHPEMLMDFGCLCLAPGQTWEEDSSENECAYLLVIGEVKAEWDGKTEIMKRTDWLNTESWVLHIPHHSHARFTGIAETTEIMVMRTGNPRDFAPKMYYPQETPDEDRLHDILNGCANRVVRTNFDKRNAPWSNLVVGEVINNPGKWAGYPPHYHDQPEIYFYKFHGDGYGHGEVGKNVYRVENNSTTFMSAGEQHAQAAAPGYAMWYLWVIRHLDGNPYGAPTNVKEQEWLLDPKAEFWGKE